MAHAEIRPSLSIELSAQLAKIAPSEGSGCTYFPCSAVTKSGVKHPCVFFVPQHEYIRIWGIYPEDDRDKLKIEVEEVAEVSESPFRLPPEYARQLYLAGESGMGYTRFELQFADGSTQACISGGAVDFVSYPAEKSGADVVGVTPHGGRGTPVPGPAYAWCLYSDDETLKAASRGLLDPIAIDRRTMIQRLKEWASR